jgi:hypothetical protein
MKYYKRSMCLVGRDLGVVSEIGSKFGSQSKTVTYGVSILLFEWRA